MQHYVIPALECTVMTWVKGQAVAPRPTKGARPPPLIILAYYALNPIGSNLNIPTLQEQGSRLATGHD
jgi:hypothetical protein